MPPTRKPSVSNETIIEAVISSPTLQKAAEVCGFTAGALTQRIRGSKVLQREIKRVRRERIQQHTAYVQQITGEALETMYEIMKDSNSGRHVQLSAAKAIVETSLRYAEIVDVMEQIDELKEAVFHEA